MKRNTCSAFETVIRWDVAVISLLALIMGIVSIDLKAQGERWFADMIDDPFELGYHTISGNTLFPRSFVDIDADGDLDMFVLKQKVDSFAVNREELYYYENVGNRKAPQYELRDEDFGIYDWIDGGFTFVDIDADGDFDIFSHTWGEYSKIIFVENTGTPEDPRFGDSVWVSNPFGLNTCYFQTAWPVFADMDNDGDLDAFITGRTYGHFFFQENIGDAHRPEFAARRMASFCLIPECEDGVIGLFPHDVDCDGDIDLIGGLYHSPDHEYLYYHENTGSAFKAAFDSDVVKVHVDEVPITFADIDGDGDMDAWCHEKYMENIYGCGGLFEEHNDFGGFIDMIDPDTRDLRFTELADLDGDGDLDMFVLTLNDSNNTCYFNDSKSLDYYENIDILHAEDCQIYKWRGAYPFGIPRTIKPLKFVDIDSDEDLDLFGVTWCEKEIIVIENTGSPTEPDFSGPMWKNKYRIDPVGITPIPAFGDFNGDGLYDLLHGGRTDGTFVYQQNIGTDTLPEFGEPLRDPFGLALPFAPNGPILVNCVDFDCDGDLDIFLTMWSIEVQRDSVDLFYYENIGTPKEPTFAAGMATGDETFVMTYADMDGDGDYDGFGDGKYFKNTRRSDCIEAFPEALFVFEADGNTVMFDGSVSSFTEICHSALFEWDFDDESAPDSGMTVVHKFPSDDVYNVCLTVTDVAGSDTYCETVRMVNLRDLSPAQLVVIYPNPASEQLFIKFNNTKQAIDGIIEIYDVQGHQVYGKEIDVFHGGEVIEVPLNNIIPGLYALRLTGSNLECTSQLVVVPR